MITLHLSRVVCRRAERSVVSVVNEYKEEDTIVIEYLNVTYLLKKYYECS